jgi:hypothetical protein
VVLLGEVGQGLLQAGRGGEAGSYLYRAVSLSALHGPEDRRRALLASWAEHDPASPLLARARRIRAARED